MNNEQNKKHKVPIKHAVLEQLESHQLEKSQLDTLLRMQQDVSGQQTSWAIQKRAWLAALAASVMVVVFTFGLTQYKSANTNDYAVEIALEVINNHLKLKPLDVQTQSIEGIQRYFTHLDFLPINSSLLNSIYTLPETSMLGGRYCSIKGVTAAQLRYQQSEQGLSTLYEVAYDKSRFGVIPSLDQGEAPRELLLKGLKVSLWVEKGLLLVLVTNI